MKYIIHSNSERGFWNNKLGWVYGAGQATKFTHKQYAKMHNRLPIANIRPISVKNDTEWLVYKYSE